MSNEWAEYEEYLDGLDLEDQFNEICPDGSLDDFWQSIADIKKGEPKDSPSNTQK